MDYLLIIFLINFIDEFIPFYYYRFPSFIIVLLKNY